MRIIADITVVAEEKEFARRDDYARHRIGKKTLNVGFGELNTVNVNDSIVDAHSIAGEADDTFNPFFIGAIRGLKDYYIPSLRFAEPVGSLENDDALALSKVRFHARLKYFIGL